MTPIEFDDTMKTLATVISEMHIRLERIEKWMLTQEEAIKTKRRPTTSAKRKTTKKP